MKLEIIEKEIGSFGEPGIMRMVIIFGKNLSRKTFICFSEMWFEYKSIHIDTW